ncbi:endonuclease/exonuclease/phosphatase family protein [Profundibacterium mesophilum]|uniref:Alkaline phosphatase D n=1 Tax=Profundibacterium mesophilum KAUST100406-0324 TaxID=1037889 RepID=A0A921NR89_9RHOB|nr:endonuclease/exonuclease/phosphatase family protein [Profundibacterium mesophilum]KAF0676007.1 alkaline phosphatase D [Profundibacterium mesophilum KAUST100406-0324]
MSTGLDLDGDGRLGTPRDAQGYGPFAGAGGMAVLSRHALAPEGDFVDHGGLLWADLPGALLPTSPAPPFTKPMRAVQRLSSQGHWQLPALLPGGRRLTLLTWHATPPVFDGPADRNGRRNHDEAAFWSRLLDGALGHPPPAPPYVLLGDANIDPHDGAGRKGAIRALLADPRLVDTRPRAVPGRCLPPEGPANAPHLGDPCLDTADWADGEEGPGNLRTDYVLLSADLRHLASGLAWPPADAPAGREGPPRHAIVWADIALGGDAARRAGQAAASSAPR